MEDKVESGKQVLIVDDEPAIRNLVRRVLGMDGYAVLDTENGLEALRLLKEHQVGLVITDFRMPTMRGDELVSHVKEVSPDSKVVLISAYPEEVEELNLPIDALLAKPFRFDELRQTVARVLPA